MKPEEPLFFDCAGDQLLGILHHPFETKSDVGVLLVVGGPQYRVGSHRQFVLLARALASAGVPVFRFDSRGMGDSTGTRRNFDSTPLDIRRALDTFFDNSPAMRRAVTWGLCDAATANAFYAVVDPRIVGQIAVNPWAHTTEGEARTLVRHYYPKRAISGSFWRKIMSLKYDPLRSFVEFLSKLGYLRKSKYNDSNADNRPLPERLREAQITFGKPTLLILSGQDLTSKEYENRVAESPAWQTWMVSPEVDVCKLDEADHTFSRALWRDQVAVWSRDWILRLGR